MLNKLAAVSQKINPKLRGIISNIGWLFLDRILRLGVGVIVVALMARYLGPQDFGIFNYAISLVILFRAFATLGLDRIVVRDIVKEPSCKDETLGTAFALRIIGGIVTWLLTVGTIWLARPNDTLSHGLVAILATATIFEAFDTIDFWFQWQVKSKYTVVAKNIPFILMTGIRLILIHTKAPVMSFAIATLAETILGAICLVIVYQLQGERWRIWRVSLNRAQNLLKESWPLIISSIAIMIYLRIDQIMLGQMIGDESVGIYAATIRISGVWYFVPMGIIASVAPAITEAKKTSEELYYNRLQKLFNIMVGLAYSIAIPMTFLAKYILVIVFGESYVSGSNLLIIQAWTAVFCFLGMPKSQIWIINEGLTRYNLIEKCIGAILNILLNLWLIPIYQENGAAIATFISYGFVDYCMCFLYPPARKIGWLMTKALALNVLINRNLRT